MIGIAGDLAALLGHVGQFVGKEAASFIAGGIVLALVEEDVVAVGERPGGDTFAEAGRCGIRVDADLREVLPKSMSHGFERDRGHSDPSAFLAEQGGLQFAGKSQTGTISSASCNRPAERTPGKDVVSGGIRLAFIEVTRGCHFQFCVYDGA